MEQAQVVIVLPGGKHAELRKGVWSVEGTLTPQDAEALAALDVAWRETPGYFPTAARAHLTVKAAGGRVLKVAPDPPAPPGAAF